MLTFKTEKTKTSQWSGGQTTELFIYPEHSEFEKRDFLLRVSWATVNQTTTTFTTFEGFERILIPVVGNCNITINEKSFDLKPFESIKFSGKDKVMNKGKVSNFNIIHAAHLKPKVKKIELQTLDKLVTPNKNWFIHVFEGALATKGITIQNKNLSGKTSCQFESPDNTTIFLVVF